MDEEEAKQLLEYIPQKERDSYDASDFAGPDRSFPITSQAQLDAAAHLIGHADNPEAVKRKAKAIAKRKGFTLPKAWQDEGDGAKEETKNKTTSRSRSTQNTQNPPTSQNTQEALVPPASTQEATEIQPYAPKSRIATLTTRFLRDNARSLNGRIYPREAVDTLVRSGKEQLAQNANLTSYTSHIAADEKDPFKLSGMITDVWREGNEAFARFNIPDTTVGRDMVALVHGGYLKTMSLRAKNADLSMKQGFNLPVVGGPDLQLEGIDFAVTPGLPDVAHIQGMTLESNELQRLVETFELDTTSLILEEETSTDKGKITESIPMIQHHMTQVHDHLHEMCMGAREAGRTFSKASTDKIGIAHDATAMALGIECRYVPGDFDNDGIPDALDPRDNPNSIDGGPDGAAKEQQQQKQEEEHMTREEMIAALAAEGITVNTPKTAEELLQEKLDEQARVLEAKFEERLKALTPANNSNPQRKSLVEGANTTLRPRRVNELERMMREELAPQNWEYLADRANPLPENFNPKWALALHVSGTQRHD